VGVVDGEEWCSLLRAKSFEAVGFGVSKFEDGDLFLRGDPADPVVVAEVALDVRVGWTRGLSRGSAG